MTSRTGRLRRGAALAVVVAMASGGGLLAPVSSHAQTTTLVSRSSAGGPSGGHSSGPSISRDGRHVAFDSAAGTIVAGDTNGTSDVFVTDMVTGTTTRVSLSSAGVQALGASRDAAISGNGRYVAFASTAANLVPGDTNSAEDVFVHDRQTGLTTRVSVAAGGVEATGDSNSPSISDDGRLVAFASAAPNLVPGDTNGHRDVFVNDRGLGRTYRVSVRSGGWQAFRGDSYAPDISAGQRFVAFTSAADNLVHLDTNGVEDVFVHDLSRGETWRANVGPAGVQAIGGPSGGASLDSDGRYVAYSSKATNLVPGDSNGCADVFLFETATGTTRRISLGQGDVETRPSSIDCDSGYADVDPLGVVVAYSSHAPSITPDDPSNVPSVFLRDIRTGITTRLDVSFDGSETVGASFAPTVSWGGRYAAFSSNAGNLVAGDPGHTEDVFRRDLDADADGLPAWWEDAFGIDARSGTGSEGALGDPDADGRTNKDEYAETTHPRGLYARYLAEGATSEFFTTRIALLNPAGTNHVQLRFQKSDGDTTAVALTLPGTRRATFEPRGHPALSSAEFSTVIESDLPLAVDRQMQWDAHGYGSHAETAVDGPRTTWYLAEGATHHGFQLFYLVQNPGGAPATVDVTYLRPAPDMPLVKSYMVAPRSRFNIWVNAEAASDPALAGLAATDVSARLDSDHPVVVERAMYLHRHVPTTGQMITFNAGHESAAVAAPALSWFLAEGATGPYFDEFILVANPGEADAAVQVQYLLGDGQVLTKAYDVRAASRFNIWVNEETFPGQGKALADTAVSAIVTSTNGVPIIVERSMWWPRPSPTWMEAHNSPGTTATGTKWGLAEGEAGGPSATETYILIANTSSFAGTARVTLVVEGAAPYVVDVPLPANSRTNVPVIEAWFPGITGKRFGALIESLGPTPAQIVVERAMYSDAEGVHWAAGSNAVATRLAP